MDNEGQEIECFTVDIGVDIEGTNYKTVNRKEIYCNLINIIGKTLYVRKDILLDTLLKSDLEPLINKSIYGHGYPEERLVPSDHYEKCREYFAEELKETFNDMIDNLIEDYQ